MLFHTKLSQNGSVTFKNQYTYSDLIDLALRRLQQSVFEPLANRDILQSSILLYDSS